MTELIKHVWDVLDSALELLKADDKSNSLNISSRGYDYFKKEFNDLYDIIMDEYMVKGVKYLDRHKVASIIMISIVKTVDIEFNSSEEVKVLWGKETVALNIGLSYMCSELNKVLNENGWKEEVEEYFMPEAASCMTDFADIMVRNMIYTENNDAWALNPLEMSEKLFLLEYITVMKKNIPLEYLNTKTS